jgi:hypothetical protein
MELDVELMGMNIEELYRLARKSGILHDDSLSKEELVALLTEYRETGHKDMSVHHHKETLEEEGAGKNHDNYYADSSLEALYEIALKKGLRVDESMGRDDLINAIKGQPQAGNNSPVNDPVF